MLGHALFYALNISSCCTTYCATYCLAKLAINRNGDLIWA